MCDTATEEPVNLISERQSPSSPRSKVGHEQQQKEFVEAGRRQLEHFLSRNFFGQPPVSTFNASKLTSSMDPLQNAILSHFGSNGHHIAEENSGPSKRALAGRSKRRLEEDPSPPDSPPSLVHTRESQHHPLFSHGICRWTGCEMIFESTEDFISHLNSEHVISERSTAQTRVQVQIVSQLEIQIRKEKDRLEAMMEHFNKLKAEEEAQRRRIFAFELKKEETHILGMEDNEDESHSSSSMARLPTLRRMKNLDNNESQPSPNAEGRRKGSYSNNKENNDEDSPRSQSPLSPQNKSKQMVASVGKILSPDKGILDPENEVIRNREFYRTQDVRPPCTYAALIRQAINESLGRQLTLNEIYTWFQNTFAYFRRNAATWKNAVRHNLSLHKCFMRVENVKGAVWTVDESEYHRRRPQRGVPTSSTKSPSSPDQMNGSSEIFGYQQKQAALVAEHQAYLQGLGASLGGGSNLRRDDYYYPAFPFSFGLKTEEISAEEEDGAEASPVTPGKEEPPSADNQRGESLESNDSSNWN